MALWITVENRSVVARTWNALCSIPNYAAVPISMMNLVHPIQSYKIIISHISIGIGIFGSSDLSAEDLS